MAKDDLENIPSMSATRDTFHGATDKGRSTGKGGKPGRAAGKPAPASGGGAGVWARLFITVALAAAGVACGWAWQLQEQLRQSELAAEGYAMRISDLEDRLSDTDEGMNQNAAVQASRIKDLTSESKRLDTEVRKLWDNVWKESKKRLSALESTTKKQGSRLSTAESSLKATSGKVDGAAGDIAKLKSVAGDMERLMASANANQAEVERVADSLNRIDLELSKMSKRVEGNEEWVGSINAFRRQINAAMTELRADVRALQAP